MSANKQIIGSCAYCTRTAELRSFGRDGAFICVFCGASPEHVRETALNLLKADGRTPTEADIDRIVERVRQYANRFDL